MYILVRFLHDFLGIKCYFTSQPAAEERNRNMKRRDYTCEKDGVTYEAGEQVPVPGCEQECYCPKYGGTVRCKALQCPVPLCIDPEETPKSCCPSCQNGMKNRIMGINTVCKLRSTTRNCRKIMLINLTVDLCSYFCWQ